jgi:DNA-binding CsgD family transcriptional regulator
MMVERSRELAELTDLFTDCANDRGRAALISGPLACGKTELLHAFGERVVEQGALLLSAAASRDEQSLPWLVMGQLFHSAGVPDQVRDQVLPMLGLLGPAEADAPAPPPEALAAHRLCMALLELSAQQPVVISIDDVQFADAPSLLTLSSLLRRIRAHRVLVVLTTEAHQPRNRSTAWTELVRQPLLKTVQLAPLSEAGVAEVVGARCGTEEAQAHAPAFHAATGGNPMLVGALIEDLPACLYLMNTASDGDDDPDPTPSGGRAFQQAVLACLHRGDRGLLELAQGMAVLGTASSAEAVTLLLRWEAEETADRLDILDQAGIIHNGLFRHPAARQAALDSLSPAERADLHSRAAELARDGGAGSAEIAEHLVLGGQARSDWAIPVLLEAAEQALAVDQVDRAADCLRLALAECTDQRHRASITATLARAEWRLNPSSVVRHLDALSAAAADGLLTGVELVQLVRYLSWHGWTEAATDVIARLTGMASEGDPDWLPELRTVYQWLHYSQDSLLRQLPEAVRASFRAGRPKARSAGLVRAVPLGVAPAQDGGDEAAAKLAEQVLRSSLLGDHTLEALTTAMLALAHVDRAEVAAVWCDALLAEATERGATTWRAQLAGVRAELALDHGDLPLAVERAQQALELLPRQSWGVAVGAPLNALLLALVHMGQLDEAGELLRHSVPAAIFDTRFGAQFLRARGHYYLAIGRAHAALSDFQRCGELVVKRGWDVPAMLPWRSDIAQAYIGLDQRDLARELVVEQLDRIGEDAARVRGSSLRVLAAASELRRRPALLRESVDLLQSKKDKVELVAALADLSNALHHLGEFSRARMMARRALQAAKASQAKAVCATLLPSRVALDAVEAQPELAEGLAALSDAERRVASLAAVGHTNREISRKLFITVSTVEQHLTRVYRKLKVARRDDLPTILHLDIAESA